MQDRDDTIIAILGIGTAVPEYRLDQRDTADRIAEALREYPDSARWAKRLFKQCGVESRYTCEPDLLLPADNCKYLFHSQSNEIPTTADRMSTYKREAVPLGKKAAQRALRDSGTEAIDITHIITVSCTGQFLPGMDTELVRQLGLAANVNRIPLNFLGCAAGLKAVCLARELAAHDPTSKVLVVSVELCTLHIQPSSGREALFGASFFGDGASACVIGSTDVYERKGIFQLGKGHSVLLAGGTEEMIWEVANFGFDLYLSTNIPKLIGQFVPEQIERLMEGKGQPELWAIHPGGKGIIETLADVYHLTEEQTNPSRSVLRQYGNMSSATILFVMDEMRKNLDRKQWSSDSPSNYNGIALAFGPGLTCEMIEISYLPHVVLREQLVDSSYVQ